MFISKKKHNSEIQYYLRVCSDYTQQLSKHEEELKELKEENRKMANSLQIASALLGTQAQAAADLLQDDFKPEAKIAITFYDEPENTLVKDFSLSCTKVHIQEH